MDRKTRSRRRITAAITTFTLVCVGLPVLAPSAAAATADPYTRVVLTKTYDGTGHGTRAQTFITSSNGFAPADDFPYDGVVASGDDVAYELQLQFGAAEARDVVVDLDLPEWLSLAPGSFELLSRPGSVVTVKDVDVENGRITFSVPAGQVQTLTRPIVLRANDTAGTVQTDQVLVARVARGDSEVFAEAAAPAVTVVSVPMADLTIEPSTKAFDAEAAPRGCFTITPRVLRHRDGSIKGASTAGLWMADVDVSAFPPGTTWTSGDSPLTVSDGKVHLEGTRSKVLCFVVPGDKWPEPSGQTPDPGYSMDYPVHLIVDPASFSVDPAILNNGDGSQPGDGQGPGYDTYDATTGAARGVSYPNNDWAAARVNWLHRPSGPGLTTIEKILTAPSTPSQTLFDVSNQRWDAASTSRLLGDGSPIAPGTQLTATLEVRPETIEGRADDVQVVVTDSWNPAEQSVDASRLPVSVRWANGEPVDPSLYTVQWSASRTHENVDPAVNTGWFGEVPVGARALRVVFAKGAVPVGEGAPRIQVSAPFVADGEFTEEHHGMAIEDVAIVAAGGARVMDDVSPILVLPRPEGVAVAQEVRVTSAQDGRETTTAVAGDSVEFVITPRITDVHSTRDRFDAVVRICLDPNLIDPVATSLGWDMRVVPGAEDCASGRALEFTRSGVAPSDAGGSLPGLSYRAAVSALLDGPDRETHVATITSSPVFSVTRVARTDGTGDDRGIGREADGDWVLSTATDTDRVLVYALGEALAIATGNAKVEACDAFVQNVKLKDVFGKHVQQMVALPADGKGWTEGLDEYGGPTTSTFEYDTSVTLTLRAEESTPVRVRLHATSQNLVSGLDPTAYEWQQLTLTDGKVVLPAGTTAFRIEILGGDGVSAASVDVSTSPSCDVGPNLSGDVYLLTPGPAYDSGGNVYVRRPWPVHAQVVDSSVAGALWWDLDADGVRDDGEPVIAGVTVGLFPRGTAGDFDDAGTPLATAVTDEYGGYVFDGLHSGEYVVLVDTDKDAAEGIFAAYTDAYGVARTVGNTFTYPNLRGDKATDLAAVKVGIGADLAAVDFGYVKPEPLVVVDKDVERVKANGDGTYGVEWSVKVTNDGNTTLPIGTLVDRTSDDVAGVTATLDPPSRIEVLYANNGRVYYEDGGGVLWFRPRDGEPVKLSEPGWEMLASTSGAVHYNDQSGVLWSVLHSTYPETLQSFPDVQNAHVVYASRDWQVWLEDASGSLWAANGTSVTKISDAGWDFRGSYLNRFYYTPASGTLHVSDGFVQSEVLPAGATLLSHSTSYVWYQSADGAVWLKAGVDAAVQKWGADARLVHVYTEATGTTYAYYENAAGELWFAMANSETKVANAGWTLVYAQDAEFWYLDAEGALWSQHRSLSSPAQMGNPGDAPLDISNIVVQETGVVWYESSDGALWEKRGVGAPIMLSAPGWTLVHGDAGKIAFTDPDGVLWAAEKNIQARRLSGAGIEMIYGYAEAYWYSDPSGAVWLSDGRNPGTKVAESGWTFVHGASRSVFYQDATGALFVRPSTAEPRKLADAGWETVWTGQSNNRWLRDAAGVLWSYVGMYGLQKVADAGWELVFVDAETSWIHLTDASGVLWRVRTTDATERARVADQWPPPGAELHRKPMTPLSEVAFGEFVERTYAMPSLRPGESVTLYLTGTVLQPPAEAGDLVVANQALYDSKLTPATDPGWSGEPAPEDVDEYSTEGEPGDDDTNLSEDHVASIIPAAPPGTVFGSISGMVWQDVDRNDVRDGTDRPHEGARVELRDAAGDAVAATMTDVDGSYEFAQIPLGEYTVHFVKPAPGAVWLEPGPWSDVLSSTSAAPPVSLTSDAPHATDVDAGFVLYGPAIETVLGEPGLDEVELVAVNGEAGDTSIGFSVTNTGDEPLTSIRVTPSGTHHLVPPQSFGDWTITVETDGSWTLEREASLAVGESITGTVSLDSVTPGSHVDVGVTATGVGVSSREEVEDDDPWSADVLDVGLEVDKVAFYADCVLPLGADGKPDRTGVADTSFCLPIPSGGALIGSSGDIVWRYTVVNTGTTGVTGVRLEDVAGEVPVEVSRYDTEALRRVAPDPVDVAPGGSVVYWSLPAQAEQPLSRLAPPRVAPWQPSAPLAWAAP